MKYTQNYKIFELLSTRKELNRNSIHDSIIEPALMTLSEYLEFLGANKQHPDSSYQFSISEEKPIENSTLKTKYTYLNSIKHGSIYVKYYVNNGEDFKNNKYVKTDKNGDILRDKNNEIIYLTDNEIKEKGITYDRDVIAVHNNYIVGSAQDEWGCVLIYVVNELKGVGIGNKLVDFYRSFYPSKSSGGTTTMGYLSLIKYHKRQVKLYLRNGIYSDMIKKGEITKSKVNDILNSITKHNISYKHIKDNLYTKYQNITPDKTFIYDGNDIMMISSRIIDYYEDYNKYYKNKFKYTGKIIDQNTDQFIFGHLRIHEEDYGYRLYFIDAVNINYMKELLLLSLSYIKEKYNSNSVIYYIGENTSDVTKNLLENIQKDSKFQVDFINNDSKRLEIRSDYKLNINKLYRDTHWFENIPDKYGQIKESIIEDVYQKFQ